MKFSHVVAMLPSVGLASAIKFGALKAKMEKDVLELRAAAEAAYLDRCINDSWKDTCKQSNYHACGSSFPNPVCMKQEHDEAFYGRKGACMPSDENNTMCHGSTWDFSVSSVVLPGSSDAANQNELESICASQALDKFFVEKRATDSDFWAEQGMSDTPWMYFGASDGVFRMYPARPDESCGSSLEDTPTSRNGDVDSDFDPRERSWYQMSSPGGPTINKNVIMLLDNSGSTTDSSLAVLKKTATGIVNALNPGDRLVVMPFSNRDELEGFETVLTVNEDTKALLKVQIDQITAFGASNFYGAFSDVFRTLDDATEEGRLVDKSCPSVTDIVFLTDLQMEDATGTNIEGFLDYFQRRFEQMQNDLPIPLVNLFWIDITGPGPGGKTRRNVGAPAQTVFEVTKTEWTRADNNLARTSADTDPVFYYQMLSDAGKPLEVNTFDDHTAWVQPYRMGTNGAMGISVSTPVFDRTLTPPTFVGVVGMDLPVEVLENTMGDNDTLEDLMDFSNVLCPIPATIKEQIEALDKPAEDEEPQSRSRGTTCANTIDMPEDVFATSFLEPLSFAERACCHSGNHVDGICMPEEEDRAIDSPAVENIPVTEASAVKTSESDNDKSTLALAIGIPIGVVALIGLGYISSQAAKGDDSPASTPGGNSQNQEVSDDDGNNDTIV